MADVGQELALEPVGLEEGDVGFGQLAETHIQGSVNGAQFLLRALQVSEHVIERLTQLLELVAGRDLPANVQRAVGDPLAPPRI